MCVCVCGGGACRPRKRPLIPHSTPHCFAERQGCRLGGWLGEWWWHICSLPYCLNVMKNLVHNQGAVAVGGCRVERGTTSVSVITWLGGLLDHRGRKQHNRPNGARFSFSPPFLSRIPNQPGSKARGNPKNICWLYLFLDFFSLIILTSQTVVSWCLILCTWV